MICNIYVIKELLAIAQKLRKLKQWKLQKNQIY
jgi:hypothetical protein